MYIEQKNKAFIMKYNLEWPNVKGRKQIEVSNIKYGDVVAVAEYWRNSFTNEIEFGRTGLAVMESPNWAIWYINLCKEEGREWGNDPLPDDVMLFEPTDEEEYFGKLIFLKQLFNAGDVLYGKILTDADVAKYLKTEFLNVFEYIKEYSEKWGYRFWDDAIDIIVEAKRLREDQLANLKSIKKYPNQKQE